MADRGICEAQDSSFSDERRLRYFQLSVESRIQETARISSIKYRRVLTQFELSNAIFYTKG